MVFTQALCAAHTKPLILLDGNRENFLRDLGMQPGALGTAFFNIERPPSAKVGESFKFGVMQLGQPNASLLGGSTYPVLIVKPYKALPAPKVSATSKAAVKAKGSRKVKRKGKTRAGRGSVRHRG
jgi:hypothetical protein